MASTLSPIKTGLAGLALLTSLYEGYRFTKLDSDWITAGRLLPRSVNADYFKNRVIWITGASSGIGRALCCYLVALKVNVKLIISSRRQSVLNDLKSDILTKHKNEIYSTDILVLPLDLTSKSVSYYHGRYESIKSYFNISSIDILVNNAGIGMLSEFHKFPAQNSTDMLWTNLVSSIILSQMVLSDIIGNNKNDRESPFGHICNIGSVIAYLLIPGQTTYGATKAGMLGFGTSLASELEKYPNVTITDVLPGPVATNIDVNSKKSGGKIIGQKASFIQNGMSPERCAELICIAMSHRLRESWTIKGKLWYATYLSHYHPWLFHGVLKPMMLRAMAKPKLSKL